jgi:putative transcriptional regulator
MLTVIETPLFQKQWPLYWTEDERGAFAAYISAHPNAGNVAPESGGLRKVRWKRKGPGKSGGVRAIYFTRTLQASWSCSPCMPRPKPTTSTAPSLRRFIVPSKTKPLSNAELDSYEAQRDLGAELLQSIREMKSGQGRVAYSEAIDARKNTGLSQSQFATLLGVSVRTLQGWEQGRKQPSGAAKTLLAIAKTNPAAVLAVVEK